jgi:hypothetical protein
MNYIQAYYFKIGSETLLFGSARGIFKTQRGKMKMKKAFALALLAILGISSLSFAVVSTSAAGPDNSRGWGWSLGSLMKSGVTGPFQRSWIRLNGIVETWGSQDVNGSLSVNARTVGFGETVRQAAFATAIWSNTTNFRETGNFSYSFYVTRLVNANVSALNFDDVDLFMNGTWNVFNVTLSQTIIKSGDLESGYTIDRQTKTNMDPIANKAYGELNVTDNWTKFVLKIDGVDELNGVVTRARMNQMVFNKFKVSEDGTDKVSRVDLTVLARIYGARPGWGSYDSNMDFNYNYKIDITDLTTVAANVQT